MIDNKFMLGPTMYFSIQNNQLWFYGGDNISYILDDIDKAELIAWLQEEMPDVEQAAPAE